MPIVTATPRGQANGQVVTEFVDSVGTSSVTYKYKTTQEWLSVRNTGSKDITVTVGGTSQTVTPGQRWEKSVNFLSFDIVSTGGMQSFEATADESGVKFDTPEGRYLSVGSKRDTSPFPAMDKNTGVIPINFQRISASPIITSADIGTAEMGFPCMVAAYKYLSNPIDRYYMYVTPHNTPGGAYLLTAPTPTGPFTFRQKILDRSIMGAGTDHISSLDVIYVPEKRMFHGYIHAAQAPGFPGQLTWLLYSTDGINWTHYDISNPVFTTERLWYAERSATYARVFRWGKKWGAISQVEDRESMERQGIFYSDDGIIWYPDLENPLDGVDFGFPSTVIYSSYPLVVGNTLYVISTVPNAATGDTRREMYLMRSDNGANFSLVQNTPVFSPDSTGTWDDGKIEYPSMFIDGDTLYLYYIGGKSNVYYPYQMGVAMVKLGGLTS